MCDMSSTNEFVSFDSSSTSSTNVGQSSKEPKKGLDAEPVQSKEDKEEIERIKKLIQVTEDNQAKILADFEVEKSVHKEEMKRLDRECKNWKKTVKKQQPADERYLLNKLFDPAELDPEKLERLEFTARLSSVVQGLSSGHQRPV